MVFPKRIFIFTRFINVGSPICTTCNRCEHICSHLGHPQAHVETTMCCSWNTHTTLKRTGTDRTARVRTRTNQMRPKPGSSSKNRTDSTQKTAEKLHAVTAQKPTLPARRRALVGGLRRSGPRRRAPRRPSPCRRRCRRRYLGAPPRKGGRWGQRGADAPLGMCTKHTAADRTRDRARSRFARSSRNFSHP